MQTDRRSSTMCYRRQLTVSVVVALIAYACAAPSANDIQPTEVKLNKHDLRPVQQRFPHAVLFSHVCGGTIISANWVLTAAYCTLTMSGPFVLAGTNNSRDGTGETRRVKRFVINPLFSVGPYWLNPEKFNIKQVAANWDFLLLELEEPLPLNGKTIAAAKLDDEPTLPAGLNVSFAGYGTDHHGGSVSREMHAMDLTVQSNQVCSTLKEFSSKDMLCATPRYDSACRGDNGSGLVDETGRLVGVTSWVQNDAIECKNGNLVVFARISSVRDWIKRVTKI